MSLDPTPSAHTPTSPPQPSDPRVEAFVSAARSYVGTPFHHQGRVPGAGLDCAGVLVCALRSIGFPVVDRIGYTRLPLRSQLRETLVANFGAPLPRPDAGHAPDIRRGDVLAMRQANRICHVAVALGGGRMLHGYSPAARVIECDLTPWIGDVADVYRMREE